MNGDTLPGDTTDAPDGARPSYWGVVNTHPHRERQAELNLAQQQFRVYLPRHVKTVRHARRETQVERPLFPGYLFVAIDPAKTAWRPIASTVGVRAIVQFGDRPALVDDRFIAALRERERDGVIVLPARPYEPGEAVRVVGGPFAGAVAKVLACRDGERITVLLELLQKQFSAALDVRLVRRDAEGPQSAVRRGER